MDAKKRKKLKEETLLGYMRGIIADKKDQGKSELQQIPDVFSQQQREQAANSIRHNQEKHYNKKKEKRKMKKGKGGG